MKHLHGIAFQYIKNINLSGNVGIHCSRGRKLKKENHSCSQCWNFLHFILHATSLLFFLSFNVFGKCITIRPKSSSVAGCQCFRLWAGVGVSKIWPTPAPNPTSAKTVDSDQIQLQFRLRLHNPGSTDQWKCAEQSSPFSTHLPARHGQQLPTR